MHSMEASRPSGWASCGVCMWQHVAVLITCTCSVHCQVGHRRGATSIQEGQEATKPQEQNSLSATHQTHMYASLPGVSRGAKLHTILDDWPTGPGKP